MSVFACNRCGACCRMVGSVQELAHLDRGDGACVHLLGTAGDEHECAIYDERPTLCRVDAQAPPVMQLAEWKAKNR